MPHVKTFNVSLQEGFPAYQPVGEGEQERFSAQPKLQDLEASRRWLVLLPKPVTGQLVEKRSCDSDS